MRKFTTAALAAAFLAAGAMPAAAASIPAPPTDPVIFGNGCPPPEEGYPCDPQPGIQYDKTYVSRLAAWATDLLP